MLKSFDAAINKSVRMSCDMAGFRESPFRHASTMG
jgi:hypothetical protein